MAFKKDSWLVRGVLIVAVLAFVSVPVGMLLSSSGQGRSSANGAASTSSGADRTAQLEGVVQGYTQVLTREPNNKTALEGIIDAKAALGDLEGTVEPLERLAELNPTVPRYSILLAQTKQQLDDAEGAVQVYRRVLTQVPGNVQALDGLVQLLISQDRTEAAVGLLRDTLATADQNNELNPGSVDKLSVKLLLGQAFVAQQQYDEATKIYDETIAEAKAASPTQPDFRPTLAKAFVLVEQGDDTAAQQLFAEALEMAPVQYKDSVQQLIEQNAALVESEAAIDDAEGANGAGADGSVDVPDAPDAP